MIVWFLFILRDEEFVEGFYYKYLEMGVFRVVWKSVIIGLNFVIIGE